METPHIDSILSQHKQLRYPSFSARVFALFLDTCLLLILMIPIMMMSSIILYKGRTPAVAMQEIAKDYAKETDPGNAVVIKDFMHNIMHDARVSHYLFEEHGVMRMLIDQAIQILIVAIYSVYFWHKKGATPGKMLTGLKVVDATTLGPLSWKQCVLRFLGYFPSFMVFMLGFFWIRFHKRRQGWHDLIANTLVVKL